MLSTAAPVPFFQLSHPRGCRKKLWKNFDLIRVFANGFWWTPGSLSFPTGGWETQKWHRSLDFRAWDYLSDAEVLQERHRSSVAPNPPGKPTLSISLSTKTWVWHVCTHPTHTLGAGGKLREICTESCWTLRIQQPKVAGWRLQTTNQAVLCIGSVYPVLPEILVLSIFLLQLYKHTEGKGITKYLSRVMKA